MEPAGDPADDASTLDLFAASEPVRQRVLARHEAREASLAASRAAVRAAANAIRTIHRGELEAADRLIVEARGELSQAVDACAQFPDVLYAGFVHDAAKEVAEAVLTRAACADEPLPDADAIGVDEVAWLHGLAETVGELRRACLDLVRGGGLDTAERRLALMQEILSVLVTIDAPDGLTRGLRRATDAARAITERTRGDLTAAVGQRDLKRALDAHRDVLEQALDRDR